MKIRGKVKYRGKFCEVCSMPSKNWGIKSRGSFVKAADMKNRGGGVKKEKGILLRV